MLNKKRVVVGFFLILASFIMIGYYSDSFKVNVSWFIFLAVLIVLYFRQVKAFQFQWSMSITAVALSLFWMASSYNGGPYGGNFIFNSIILIATFFAITAFVLLLIQELKMEYKVKNQYKPKWTLFALFSLIPFLVWMMSFLAYYPAKMTFDSYFQWGMAHGIRQYSEWHPMLHTLWIQATSFIYNSPANYIFSQIVVVSLIVGYAVYTLVKMGARIWIGIVISIGYAIYPVAMIYSATAWKDFPFAAFILLFTVLILKTVQSNGEWLKNWWHFAAFILVAFICINLRNNGIMIVMVSLVFLLIFMKNFRVIIGGILVGTLGLNFLFSFIMTNGLHAQSNPLNQALAIPSQQIGATFYNDGDFTPELKEYFTSILPEENWKKDYNPYTVDPIKHDAEYDASVIEDDFGLYIKNWFKLLTHNFGIYVGAYLDQIAVIWQFDSPDDYKVYFDTPADIQDMRYDVKAFAQFFPDGLSEEEMNKLGYENYQKEYKAATGKEAICYSEYKERINDSTNSLISITKSAGIKKITDDIYTKTTEEWQNYLLKGAIPLFFLIIALASVCFQSSKKRLLIFVPVLMAIITIAVAMPATDFRYCYSFVFTVPIVFFATKLKVIEKNEV
ncbi:hypothetical protein C1903_03725 [Listeria ivanovii]|uniref:DUF6020 family protein n=1 Tax=Listeria ivanovii TaxID=1638 RepID=UPI000DA8F71D|nr:DUF6020 family protein [Listeria ivanovii]PZF90350.1 hypothetical protein C1905_03650 [Listeria ivanovii]PZF95755.1 hypothetical protein C1903_03725 [Listeria ivanovii]PZG06031.1 hypothetical protein C2L88_03720 [Listeria ivanovii]PZG10869.1 hypothetical protein C1901_03720 [Listeria ivanovii]PZG27866.1 hypothetical protein C1900_03655 [Listeria ivanovii]